MTGPATEPRANQIHLLSFLLLFFSSFSFSIFTIQISNKQKTKMLNKEASRNTTNFTIQIPNKQKTKN